LKFRAVFLDAGETLLSPHPSFEEVFCNVLADCGHEVIPRDISEAWGSLISDLTDYLDQTGMSAWSTSPEASRQFWGMLYARLLAGLDVPDADQKLAEAIYSRFTQYDSYRLFDDSRPALTALRGAGLAVGLISNFEGWLEGMLTQMGVADSFDHMIISGKEGLEKPDPAIFHLALERGGVRAAETAYIGDHLRLDVEASEAVGMTGILLDRKGRHRGFEGHRIESLSDLLPLLEAIE